MTRKQRRLLLRFCSSLTTALARAALLALVVTGASSALLQGCHKAVQHPKGPIFGSDPPLNGEFRQELHYLESTGKLPSAARLRIEQEIEKANVQFGVPTSLLWCLFFQESRLDPLKNADRAEGAHGLGQFTRFALEEINEDTDHFDDRTSEILNYSLKPHRLPISFDYKAERPKQARTSYFHPPTAVAASAAYLNNRYFQLRRALERQGLAFDPQVLWLFAAAAYEKGARSVFALLTRQRLKDSDEGLAETLSSPKLAYALLTRKDLLEPSLRQIFAAPTHEKLAEELSRNMESILSCAIPESER